MQVWLTLAHLAFLTFNLISSTVCSKLLDAPPLQIVLSLHMPDKAKKLSNHLCARLKSNILNEPILVMQSYSSLRALEVLF